MPVYKVYLIREVHNTESTVVNIEAPNCQAAQKAVSDMDLSELDWGPEDCDECGGEDIELIEETDEEADYWASEEGKIITEPEEEDDAEEEGFDYDAFD